MTGETDLRTLLATMEPRLSETEFGFGTVADPAAAGAIVGVVATFVEEEGLSVIVPASALAEAGVTQSGGWAKISLTVHSSLSTVGLTAALATALAAEGISANIVAAYFHDHVFVPWEQRLRAMHVLAALAAGDRHPS